ncbi:MAG: ABC transporter permease [Thiotrichales bacterium]|nr:ABC transporter permease [Thiotrichales bacterium]
MALVAQSGVLQADTIHLDAILAGPSLSEPLGQDDLGRSLLGRVVTGARTSLLVALTVVLVSALIGIPAGIISAWFGGWYDRVFVLLIDIFMAFPGLLLAIALAGLLGPGMSNAIIALAVVGWVGFARLARAQTLSVKERTHVLAARAQGIRTPGILNRHVLPLILAPLIVQATFDIAGAVIAEATLSFLGLGVQAPEASWGSMIRDGVRYMLPAPHMVLAPGVAIFLVVLSINLFGDRLRDRLDVRTDRQIHC